MTKTLSALLAALALACSAVLARASAASAYDWMALAASGRG